MCLEEKAKEEVDPVRVDVGEGLNLNYVEEGEGEAFVFTVGPGFEQTSQPDHLKLFSSRFRTIQYDTRGSGKSDDSDWYSFKSGCDDLVELLRALNIQKAIIYGGSSGGIQGLMFAYSYPEHVRALIVDGTSTEINIIAAKNWRTFAEKTLLAGKDATEDMVLQGAVRGGREGEFKVETALNPARYDVRARFSLFLELSNLYEHPITPYLGDITCPVLALHGEDDKLVGPGGSVRISRAIPGSQLRILPGCGHTVLATSPDTAKKEVLTFLDGLSTI